MNTCSVTFPGFHGIFPGKGADLPCPFYDSETTVCKASFSSFMADEEKRTTCCANENFDDCALFLAKLLRMG